MKVIKVIDEDTLEIKDVIVEDETELTEEAAENVAASFRQALSCDPEEFAKRYKEFKEAKVKFDEVYEPFKLNLISMHKEKPELPKSVVVGGAVKVTYVSPSTRSSIDSKKLKEEEPAIAEKFTKTTNVTASVRIEEL